jgi:hypothetical protein
MKRNRAFFLPSLVLLALAFYPLHAYTHLDLYSSSHCSVCHTGFLDTAPASGIAAPAVILSFTAKPSFPETRLEAKFSAPTAPRAPPSVV